VGGSGYTERGNKDVYGGCILYLYRNRRMKTEIILRRAEGEEGE
jgi:anthranilate/para-aminobenzoate synthase component I